MAPHVKPDAAVPVRWQPAPTPLGAGHVGWSVLSAEVHKDSALTSGQGSSF